MGRCIPIIGAVVLCTSGCNAGVSSPSTSSGASPATAPPPAATPRSTPPLAPPATPRTATAGGPVLFAVTNRGIDSFAIDPLTGALGPGSSLAFASPGPSFADSIAVDPLGRFLYVAVRQETAALAIGPRGVLTRIPHAVDALEAGTQRLAIAPDGALLVGSIFPYGFASYAIRPDGTLGKVATLAVPPSDSAGPSGVFDPSGRFFYAFTHVAAGSGPGLPSFSVMAVSVSPGGALQEVGRVASTITRPNMTAIALAGDHVYLCGRTVNDVVIEAFRRDAVTGALAPVAVVATLPPEQGWSPVALVSDASGAFFYVACDSGLGPGQLLSFRRDAATGALARAGAPLPLPVETWSLALSPKGDTLYAASAGSGPGTPASLASFTIDAATRLPVAAGVVPFALAVPTAWVASTP